jgi:hypothetical protein
MNVTPRTLALVVATIAVFGLGVYLFVEVRAAPAPMATQPEARRAPVVAAHEDPVHDEAQDAPPSVSAKPLGTAKSAAMRGADREPVHLGTTEVSPDDLKANPKLDAVMDEANKAYDHQEFDDAKAIAAKVLMKQPGNVRMLRVMVSSSCVDGDKDTAQKYFEQLPKFDRDQMRARCDRYAIALKDPGQ